MNCITFTKIDFANGNEYQIKEKQAPYWTQNGPHINLTLVNWRPFIMTEYTNKVFKGWSYKRTLPLNGVAGYFIREGATRGKVLTKFWIVIFWIQITDTDNASSHL